MDEPDPVEDGSGSEKGVVVEDRGHQGWGKGRELVDREKGEGKKRVRERGKGEDEEMGSLARDPLTVLGPDILSKVLSHLDAFSVARALLVSRGWQRVSSSDLLWGRMIITLLMDCICMMKRRDEMRTAFSLSVRRIVGGQGTPSSIIYDSRDIKVTGVLLLLL